jgi:NOL1/NOP2/sun family putative RNA methylase
MLPHAFAERMKTILLEDYPAFLREMEEMPARHAFRVNTIKISVDEFCARSDIPARKIPYTQDGFYHDEEKIGNHPFHHAGMLYSQDPGAMATLNALHIPCGARVLDMCASPGGKSAQLAAAIGKDGLLVSNEYVPSRCKLLVGNIERLGIPNALVLNTDSKTLGEWYPDFFDLVLVDAPCSGEGMFRKSEEALADWSEETVRHCAERQTEILENAIKTVAPGGYLLYSTCTFAIEENEAQVAALLEKHPEFHLCPVKEELCKHTAPGLPVNGRDLSMTRRFYPHIAPGEGQYLALLRRDDGGERAATPAYRDTSEAPPKTAMPALRAFFADAWGDESVASSVRALRGNLILPPPVPLPPHSVFAAGVLVGEVRKDICFPHHQLFSAYGCRFVRRLSLSLDDKRLHDYLHGEVIPAEEVAGGYCAVTLAGCPLGGGKASGGMVKNLYPKGLRLKG